jgi:hypothetical protein
MAQSDPVAQLAATINQIYGLAGNLPMNDPNRVTLITKAHDLKGDLTNMVSVQLTDGSPVYNDLTAKLNQTTTAINAAAAKTGQIVDVINNLSALASSIDTLLQAAAQTGALIAKV